MLFQNPKSYVWLAETVQLPHSGLNEIRLDGCVFLKTSSEAQHTLGGRSGMDSDPLGQKPPPHWAG